MTEIDEVFTSAYRKDLYKACVTYYPEIVKDIQNKVNNKRRDFWQTHNYMINFEFTPDIDLIIMIIRDGIRKNKNTFKNILYAGFWVSLEYHQIKCNYTVLWGDNSISEIRLETYWPKLINSKLPWFVEIKEHDIEISDYIDLSPSLTDIEL